MKLLVELTQGSISCFPSDCSPNERKDDKRAKPPVMACCVHLTSELPNSNGCAADRHDDDCKEEEDGDGNGCEINKCDQTLHIYRQECSQTEMINAIIEMPIASHERMASGCRSRRCNSCWPSSR